MEPLTSANSHMKRPILQGQACIWDRDRLGRGVGGWVKRRDYAIAGRSLSPLAPPVGEIAMGGGGGGGCQ